MALFPCTYLSVQTKYPQSGTQVRLGNSYMYTAPPLAPDQRIFVVKLQGMQYFVASNGTIESVTQPGRNMAVLETFYNDHKLYLTFQFSHPVYGTINCKFNRPLEIPEGLPGGNGLLPTFELEMIEIP